MSILPIKHLILQYFLRKETIWPNLVEDIHIARRKKKKKKTIKLF